MTILPAFYCLVGCIFGLINYHFYTRKFRDVFHKVTRYAAMIISGLLVIGSISYMDLHSISIFSSDSSENGRYLKLKSLKTDYFTLRYPKTFKKAESNIPGYIYQILLIEYDKNKNEKCRMHIGIKANPSGNSFDFESYYMKRYNLLKQLLPQTDSINELHPYLTSYMAEASSSVDFSLIHVRNNIVSYEEYNICHNPKFIAELSFTYKSKEDIKKLDQSNLVLK